MCENVKHTLPAVYAAFLGGDTMKRESKTEPLCRMSNWIFVNKECVCVGARACVLSMWVS